MKKPTSGRPSRLAAVTPVTPQWLWHPYVPKGALSLLVGDPGLGKTWLSLALCAAVTRGEALPGERDSHPPRTALYLTAEDAVDATIRNRAEVVGADLERLIVWLDGMGPGMDEVGLARLEQVVQEFEPALVVIDPLQAYLGADVDMSAANEVRPRLAGLGRLAGRYGLAVVLVTHMRKSSADKAIYRSLGSIDFTAAARSQLIVAADPDDPREGRVLAHTKSSLARSGDALAFRISPTDDGRGRFRWNGKAMIDIEELLAPKPQGRPPSAREAAGEWLRGALRNGPVEVTEIYRLGDEAGHSERTLRRAKDDLGVVLDGGFWHLPI